MLSLPISKMLLEKTNTMKLAELDSTLLLNILSMVNYMILKCKWLCTTPVKLLVSIV
jgi:hypothetical protein